VTSVFVTYDQEETLELADRVGVIDKGRIEQVGTPQEVYENPATAFVHAFIGESIAMPITVENGLVNHRGLKTSLDCQGAGNGPGTLFVRPYEMDIMATGEATFGGVVRRIHGLGPARRIEVALQGDGGVVELDLPRTTTVSAGETVGLRPRQFRIFTSPG
jgi:sulfate transport system ATP-binding protein